MKLRYTLWSLFCGGIFLSTSAVEPIAESFKAIPDSLLPSIEKNSRLDLIDLFQAGQTATATNLLGGTTTLIALQDSTLSLDLTTQSKVTMRLLPYQKDETIIALIHTACAPACDSHLQFFTLDWKELPASKLVRRIDLDEFLQFPKNLSLAEQKELQQLVNIRLIEYTFTPEGNLQLTPSWKAYLDEKEWNRIQPYLRDNIVLSWSGKKFE